MRVPTSAGENGGSGQQVRSLLQRTQSDAVQLADEPRAVLFNARNAEDRDQFVEDLHEGIIEVPYVYTFITSRIRTSLLFELALFIQLIASEQDKSPF